MAAKGTERSYPVATKGGGVGTAGMRKAVEKDAIDHLTEGTKLQLSLQIKGLWRILAANHLDLNFLVGC